MEKKTTIIRRRLLAHYDGGKRDLPWRRESDPYRVWVSEIMLQQTRVETVIPYYERWVERFPTLDDLAGAEEEEVLKAWEGLGYYGRARRLHGAARVVRERYSGEVPGSSEELRTLPGVGEYTAGAVASIAFGEAVPAVDGNVRRVMSRLFDEADPSPSELRGLAASLVDPVRPGDFNQALMELGATVCTPRLPRCEGCPMGEVCEALAAGTVDQRPSRKARKPVPEVEIAVVVAVGEPKRPHPRFLLRKRPDTGLLAGLWEFPGAEVQPPGLVGETARGVAASLGLSIVGGFVELPRLTHTFSHLKARYRPFLLPVPDMPQVEGGRWVSAKELNDLPLPVAQQKIGLTAMEFMESGLSSEAANESEPGEPI